MDNIESFVHNNYKKFCELDIAIEGNEIEEKMITSLKWMPQDMLNDMEENQIIAMLLADLGSIKYYEDSSEIIYRSDKVYAFDVEFYDIDEMYTTFFKGIESIFQGDIKINDIKEQMIEFDEISGKGKKKVDFKLNGHNYEYIAHVDNDWFDSNILTFLSKALEKEKPDKELLVTSDGMQECILFYNTKEWAEKFNNVMGYPLEKL